MDNIDNIELELAIKALRDEIKEKDREIEDLKFTLFEHGLEDVSKMSDEMFICVNEIKRLKNQSQTSIGLDDKEVKMFEILNKSLHMIKNGVDKKALKGKDMTADELMRIVDGGKKG